VLLSCVDVGGSLGDGVYVCSGCEVIVQIGSLGLGIGHGGKAIAAVNKIPNMIVSPASALDQKKAIDRGR